MRILIVCPFPMQLELGAAQVHLNLAAGLREIGHTVQVWSPYPLPERHWTVVVLEMRAKLRAFLRSIDAFDVVDSPPVLVGRRFVEPHVTWVARSVQPDLLYSWETLMSRPGRSARDLARKAALAAWMTAVASLVHRGWRLSDVVMCFGSIEREWIGRRFPWLRSKVCSYDGAVSEIDRLRLASVRRARRPRNRSEPVRYLWIGRWIEHKGIDRLMDLLRERIATGTNEQFTIAGCGEPGDRALAPLVGSGRVRVVPAFARADLPALLAAHDAGLFTSRVEGWGLVLNEMVEAGLPVYATTAGGVEDIRSVVGSFMPAFPPPPGAMPPLSPSDEALARYGARFRWPTIAARYVESVLSTR